MPRQATALCHDVAVASRHGAALLEYVVADMEAAGQPVLRTQDRSSGAGSGAGASPITIIPPVTTEDRNGCDALSAVRGTNIPPVLFADMPTSSKTASSSGDWRGSAVSRINRLIKQADPQMVEERKWKKAANPDGVPTWSHDGLVCTVETYKDHVKMTFARGASLKDPSKLFNASLEGNVRRAIDIGEGDKLDERAFKALIREAVALNQASGRHK